MIRLLEENKPLGAKIIRNVAVGGVRALVVAPIPLLLTPLILSEIGARGYGTWAVFVTMNGLTSAADLGLLGTLSKYVAEYYARRDYVRLSRLLNTGLVVLAALASLIVAVLWAASFVVVKYLFRGSTLPAAELLSLLHWSLILIWVNIVTFLTSSVTSGLQRLDLTNIMGGFNVVCSAAGGAVFLLLGWGVRGLLYGSIGSAVLTLMIYIWMFRKLLPEVKINFRLAEVAEARKIFAFSWRMYVVQASAMIQNHIEKVILALFTGVVAVGWYDIASDIALRVRAVPGLLLGPILPAAAELEARGEREKLVDLYYRAHKYLAFIGVPLVFYVAAVSSRFVELWIGPNMKIVAVPLSVLLLAGFFNQITGPGYLIFLGQGILKPGVYSALGGIGLNIPLSFVLIYFYGFKGAVVGTAVSLVAAGGLFVYLFHRQTGYSFVKLVREAYLQPVAYSVILLTVLFFARPAGGVSWLGLILQGLGFALVYAIALLFTSFFDQYDWNRLETAVPIARVARRIVFVS